MKNKCLGFILSLEDCEKFIKPNKELINELSKNFEKIYVINVLNLRSRVKKCKIINEHFFPPNFECVNFDSSKQFLNFFKNKYFVGIQYLDKNPDFFKIFLLINLSKIKNVMIMNLGNFGLSRTVDFNPKNIFAFKHYYQKGFYRLFRILTILNIFPKIDVLFESNAELINSINNGYMKKLEKKFPFLKLSYFQKIEKINSLFYDEFLKKKENLKRDNSILYVDVPIDHGDRTIREGEVSSKTKENYYKNLSKFLSNLEKIFDKNIVVGVHPSSKEVEKYFSKFHISKERTMDLIHNSEIIIVTHSSLISMMAMLNKKIISIKSKFLGKFHSNLSKRYVNSLNLCVCDIDEETNLDKNDILEKVNESINYYEDHINKYVKIDGDNLSTQTVVKKIKNIFFNKERNN